MAGFDDAWAAVAHPRDGETVSPELEPLLKQVYFDVLREPTDLSALKESLTALLEYLNGPGRTNANCWAVDMFFCKSDGWERDWTEPNLPDDFHDVLALMGEALHDTVQTPKIAENLLWMSVQPRSRAITRFVVQLPAGNSLVNLAKSKTLDDFGEEEASNAIVKRYILEGEE